MKFIAAILLISSLTASAVTCDFLSISNACATASDGDTIAIDAGTCYISNTITITKSITLRGAGTNETTLISKSITPVFTLSGVGKFRTVSNMNCVGDIANTSGFFYVSGGRYRFTNIKMTNVMYRGFNVGEADSFGLIDHCTMIIGVGAGSYNPVSFEGNSFSSWTNANPYGTTNANYVEDCYFAQFTGNGGNGFWDGYDGAQAVIRHCFIDGGAYNGTHGYDSQPTSVRTHETYNNIFTNVALNSPIDAIRGGGFMFFSNLVYAAGAQSVASLSPQLQYYRAANGTYQGTYGYAGYDKTNTYTTNWANGNVYAQSSQIAYTLVTPLSGGANRILLGATLAETLTNIALAVNLDPAGVGVKYTSGTQTNPNFRVVYLDGTTHVLKNIMDGTNAYGYPAAFQPGMMKMVQYTNTGVEMFPCYSWSNTCVAVGGASTSLMNLVVRWSDAQSQADYVPNYTTNLMIHGRDYYTNTIPAANVYTPLVYPHPLQNYQPPATVTEQKLVVNTLYLR